MVFGMVHPYIFIILVSLVFNIHCIHVCIDVVRKKRTGKSMCGATSAKKHFKTKGRCRGFKTHRATVREGINTDGERDRSQQSGQQLAARVHVTAV